MVEFLIAYGTLLHRASLAHSIGPEAAEQKEMFPVLVRDHRRLFSVRPDHYESSCMLGLGRIEAAALNVEPAAGLDLNALAFSITLAELEALDRREPYYRRAVVPMLEFDSGEPVGSGHIYIAEEGSRWVERDSKKLMPLWRDVVWARLGAYEVSEDFGHHYDRTTYLADGETLVIDVYRELLADTSDVELPK